MYYYYRSRFALTRHTMRAIGYQSEPKASGTPTISSSIYVLYYIILHTLDIVPDLCYDECGEECATTPTARCCAPR